MKRIVMLALLIALSVGGLFAQLKLVGMKGDVTVRHGVSEQWVAVAVGDVLKPDDSIRLGKKASATILTEKDSRLQIPEMTVIDLSDLRMMTQEELLLKLAMERVREIPDKGRENDFTIPRTTTIHGSNKEDVQTSDITTNISSGVMQLNGVKVLYNNGFYATSVLKAKEVFRLMPETAKMIDVRLTVASALERMNVNGEALSEYKELSKERLSPAQQSLVGSKIAQLKKKD